jgi:DNA-binding NarL/FixJ family response regulator
MHILILQDGAAALTQLADTLKHAGHDVEVVTDAATAKGALTKRKADIAVVASLPTSEALTALAGALKPPEDATYRSLIAVVLEDTAAAREAAYTAGADDVVMAGASTAELADHVRSAERIVDLERRLRERVVELESALRRLAMHAIARGKEIATSASGSAKAPPTRGGLGFLLTSTWTGLDFLLGKMCTEYLQSPFVQLVGAAAPAGGCRGSRIALTDVENELKLELSFYATDESAHAVATGFCGGDESLVDEDVIRDVLLELANSGMGAVKAGFLSEEFRFAAAIPESLSGVDPTKQLVGAEAKRVLAFRSETAVVYAIVTLRHQGRMRIPCSRLKEGMVVASDVLNDAGALLIRAGTRLSETAAEKLARMFPKREIELADAA